MLIGYYNKSVILTYIGVFFGILAMLMAFNSDFLYAHLALLASGVCDMFDGKIARMCKRSRKEKQFGIEIDSLADMLNFIAAPIVILICMGYTEWYFAAIYTAYALGGIIRLGYFNVVANSFLGESVRYYSGLPVTTTSFILPLVYILTNFIDADTYKLLMTGLFSLIAISFVYNFKIRKPSNTTTYIFLILAFTIAIGLVFFIK